MDVRSSVDGLKTLLGVPARTPIQTQSVKEESKSGLSSLDGDQATLSSAGSGVAQATSGSDARMEKVAAVQAAIAAGTYAVPATAVAGKVIEAMLSRDTSGN